MAESHHVASDAYDDGVAGISCQLGMAKSAHCTNITGMSPCLIFVMCWQVRMAPDNMTAYVLWSGLPDDEDRLEAALQQKCAS